MSSLVLRTATRYMLPLMLLFSIFLLLRGHSEPGGGFTAGLVAAAAFSLYALAYDVDAAKEILLFDPHQFIGGGLLLALIAALLPWLMGQPFLTGLWAKVDLPNLGSFELGTPVLFDIGVYLVVIGIAVLIIFSLAEE